MSSWVTHSGGEEGTGFELLQGHGAGVRAEEEDEGHEGDVRDEFAGPPHQLPSVLQALAPREGRPRGVQRLQGKSTERREVVISEPSTDL